MHNHRLTTLVRMLAVPICIVCVGSGGEAKAAEAKPSAADESHIFDAGVLQNRKYDLLHEVSFLGGGLPADPYYYGVTASLGYTMHLGQSFAWDVAQFTYSLNFDKRLKEQLYITALRTASTPPDLPEIDWIVASHAVLKPFYGKEAIFNTEVVHLEGYLQAGPALVHSTDPERPLSLGVDLGIGVRLWLSEFVSLRLDLGELLYFRPQAGGKGSDMSQAVHLHAGFGFNFRGDD